MAPKRKRAQTSRRREHSQDTRLALALTQLGALDKRVKRLERQEIRMDQKIKDLTAEMDRETNDISDRIDRLIASGNLTADVIAELQPISDRLKGLGADPANPIPPAV